MEKSDLASGTTQNHRSVIAKTQIILKKNIYAHTVLNFI